MVLSRYDIKLKGECIIIQGKNITLENDILYHNLNTISIPKKDYIVTIRMKYLYY